MNIYVANLGYGTSESQVRDAFAAYGEVTSVKLIIDQVSGRPKGFGFVEIGTAIGFVGLFTFLVMSKLSKHALAPKHHPLLDESLHHQI